jgi:hypothetical protein
VCRLGGIIDERKYVHLDRHGRLGGQLILPI